MGSERFVDVRGDARDIYRHLNAMERKVFPQAQAAALNEAAKVVRGYVVKAVATRLKLKQASMKRRVNVGRGKYRARVGKAWVTVFIKKKAISAASLLSKAKRIQLAEETHRGPRKNPKRPASITARGRTYSYVFVGKGENDNYLIMSRDKGVSSKRKAGESGPVSDVKNIAHYDTTMDAFRRYSKTPAFAAALKREIAKRSKPHESKISTPKAA